MIVHDLTTVSSAPGCRPRSHSPAKANGWPSFASYVIGFPRGGTWKVRFNGDARRYSSDFGNAAAHDVAAIAGARDGQPFRGTVALGPYSALILSQDP